MKREVRKNHKFKTSYALKRNKLIKSNLKKGNMKETETTLKT
jgi:hypothetical protein